ncbi:MAG: hypothetical protein J6S63_06295 [Atopobiaceae bacterium]|nr:hypothetical protein [Atopobiaceae bacterium]
MYAENGRLITSTYTFSGPRASGSQTRMVSPHQSACVHSPGLHSMCIAISGFASTQRWCLWQKDEYMYGVLPASTARSAYSFHSSVIVTPRLPISLCTHSWSISALAGSERSCGG